MNKKLNATIEFTEALSYISIGDKILVDVPSIGNGIYELINATTLQKVRSPKLHGVYGTSSLNGTSCENPHARHV